MSGLAKAVAALTEFDDTLRDMLDARYAECDKPLGTDDLNEEIRAIARLRIILQPFPAPDGHKGIPARRVQTRIWAGVITNPGQMTSAGDKKAGKRSRYYDVDGDTQ